MSFSENDKITDIVFREPIGDQARKYRMVSMLISVMAILITITGLSVHKILWIQIDNFETTRPIILGAFTIGNIYLFFGFIIYSWHDLKQWSLAKELTKIQNASKNMNEINSKYYSIKRYHEKISGNEYEKSKAMKELEMMTNLAVGLYTTKLDEEVSKLTKTLIDYRKLHKGQIAKLVFLDFGVPSFLAFIEIYKNHEYLIPFLKTIFS